MFFGKRKYRRNSITKIEKCLINVRLQTKTIKIIYFEGHANKNLYRYKYVSKYFFIKKTLLFL